MALKPGVSVVAVCLTWAFLAFVTASIAAQTSQPAAESPGNPPPVAEGKPQETLPRLKTSRPVSSGRWRPADELPNGNEDTAAEAEEEASNSYVVPTGTRIPLGLINSISTRSAAPGDRVYLETVFPIVVAGKIVIPPGSFVTGTVTAAERPGRVKGKGQLYLRFDMLTLPNGVTRDFLARVGGLDGGLREGLDRDEGAITGDSDKASDATTVIGTTVTGGSVGVMGGLAAGNAGRGAGIGLAAGAAAGLASVLLTRGPDVVLPAGSSLEMVTDRPIEFREDELRFEGGASRGVIRTNTSPTIPQQRPLIGVPRRGGPF
jgi:hypothetical protein